MNRLLCALCSCIASAIFAADSKQHGTCDYSTRALSNCLSSVKAAISATNNNDKKKKKTHSRWKQIRAGVVVIRWKLWSLCTHSCRCVSADIRQGCTEYIMIQIIIDFHLCLIIFRLSWLHRQTSLFLKKLAVSYFQSGHRRTLSLCTHSFL